MTETEVIDVSISTTVSLRVSLAEKYKLNEVAKKLNISTSEYIRAKLLEDTKDIYLNFLRGKV
ncbi:MAG: plasmid mobilization protein, partial [Paraclostridium sp.]